VRATLIVDGSGFKKALAGFEKHTRRDRAGALNLAGRLWASFAFSGTRRADPAEIKAYMMERISAPRGKSKSKYNGTRAEAITIASLRKKGMLGTLKNRSEVNRLVAKFVTSAVNSSGYHKAGWIPALKQFKSKGSKRRGNGRYKSPVPGNAKKAKRSEARPNGFLENFARAFKDVQGGVLKAKEADVARQLAIFMFEDMKRNKSRNGFR
jgi:hypothetical protein